MIRFHGRRAELLVVIALMSLALAGCSLFGSSPSATPTPPPTPTAFLYNGCPLTPLQHTPFASGSGLSIIPWIEAVPASIGITGHLFYAGPTTPATSDQPFVPLYTNGHAPGGANTLIIWVVQNDHYFLAKDPLQITGAELSPESGSFQQSFPAASSPSNSYPSIVVVPSPGCWKLTLTVYTLTASATFWVVKPA